MAVRPRRDELLKSMDQLTELARNPVLLGELKSLESVSEDRRLEEAQRRLNVEVLRDKGVPIPEDTRIALRYFENPENRIVSMVGIGPMRQLRKPNIVQEIASNPRLFAELSRTRPDVLEELSHEHREATVCMSVGLIVCLTIGMDTPPHYPDPPKHPT